MTSERSGSVPVTATSGLDPRDTRYLAPKRPTYFVNRCHRCATAQGECDGCGGSGFALYEAVYNEQGTAISARYIAQVPLGEAIDAGFRPYA